MSGDWENKMSFCSNNKYSRCQTTWVPTSWAESDLGFLFPVSHNCHGPNTCHQKNAKSVSSPKQLPQEHILLVIWLAEIQECKWWVGFKSGVTRIAPSAELSEFKGEGGGKSYIIINSRKSSYWRFIQW